MHLLQDTRSALAHGNKLQCDNRSLYFDRFADPTLEKDARKDWFIAGGKITVPKEALQRDPRHLAGASILHARLMDRLLLNMAGGVMENAGLCLDRYGLPFIPGSAVKGCARRMALQALHDWVEAGTARPAPGDIGTPCCEGFTTPAPMLAAICHVFGWVSSDWAAQSDLAWACMQNAQLLAAAHALLPKGESFGGSVAFLSAHPNTDPELDLDVLTPHHTKYYKGELPTATDTEDPVPVFFPAVKSQRPDDYFSFPLLQLRRNAPMAAELGTSFNDPVKHARTWLSHGLTIFGLGAKTNAGYGWFEIIEQAAVEAAKSRQVAAASDYPNDSIFKNKVLALLNDPGQYQKLQVEVVKLQKTDNATWLQILKTHLASSGGKDARKRLKEKDWFPKDWLPL